MGDDEYIPKDRWLDVDTYSCSTSSEARYLPMRFHDSVVRHSSSKAAKQGIVPGMIMRLISGSTPLIITEVVSFKRKTYVTAMYFTSTNRYVYRVASDFMAIDTAKDEAARLIRNANKYIQMCYGTLTKNVINLVDDFYQITSTNNPDSTQKGNPIMSDLYKTLEKTPRYGVRIAETSEGRVVLELKASTGTQIVDFAKDQIERVIPWTFFWNGTHYKAPKNSVVVGDFISMNGYIDVVKKVNTQNENPVSVPANARVVQSRPLLAPELATDGSKKTNKDTKADA